VDWVWAGAGDAESCECRVQQEHLHLQLVCRCAAKALPLDDDPQNLRTIADGSEHDNNLQDSLERQLRFTRTGWSIRMARIPFVVAVLALI
jgi:hypothetical protein